MITLGFDPGLDGAIATLHAERVISVIDMPTVERRSTAGKIRRRVSPAGIAELMQKMIDTDDKVTAWIENVSPRPGEGTVSSFSFGRSVGVIEGVLAGLAIPLSFVTPAEWIRELRVPRDGSIGRALELFPYMASELRRKKDHGRADAMLIGLFGARSDMP